MAYARALCCLVERPPPAGRTDSFELRGIASVEISRMLRPLESSDKDINPVMRISMTYSVSISIRTPFQIRQLGNSAE
jgi:hypothetical protein